MQILLDSQSEAIHKLNSYKVGALFMDPGTGKTRTAIELINSVTEVDHIFWFGPLQTIKSENGVVAEINKWNGFNVPVTYIGLESISQSNRIYLETRSLIEQCKCPFVIVDESLKIKNYDSKRTQRLIEISIMAEFKLILNGTPITKNLLDLWSQLEFLSPQILGMSYIQFKNTFCCYTKITKRNGHRTFTKEFITGYENIDYLYSLIKFYIYEADLKLNLTQQWFDYDYEIDEDTLKLYDEIKEWFLKEDTLEAKHNNIFLEMTQKLQHMYAITEDKFNVCNKVFEIIPQDKTIIYTKYIVSREECIKRYPKAMILSYQKDCLGLNLQDKCYTIYFDKNWDYALREQSKFRTFRTGQEEICRYYDLTGDVGLEHMIDCNINKKNKMVNYFKNRANEKVS